MMMMIMDGRHSRRLVLYAAVLHILFLKRDFAVSYQSFSSQVGFFDPYSDDPRLAVKKLALCPVSGVLVVAGTAGHIIIAELKDEAKEEEIPVGF